MKLQITLEAKKTQLSDALEKVKLNMTHTRPESKTGVDKSDRKGSTRAHDGHLSDDRCKHVPCATKDHYERLPNADAKGGLETLVSEDLQPGQGHRLMKKQSRAANEEQSQTSTFSSKAPKRSPSLEAIMHVMDIVSI